MSGDEQDRRPDYDLMVKDKLTGGSTKAGVAWVTGKDGSGISIRLNPCVVLSSGGLRDCYLTLWPNRKKHGEGGPQPGPRARQDPEMDEDDLGAGPPDDDIPF